MGLPVANGEDYLGDAIASILGQTFTDFELLIADNGSTDATASICRAWEADDSRVRHLRSEVNHGLAWNWNRLVGAASGEYFRWAAHDDLLDRELLQRCVGALDAAGGGVVLSYPRTLDIDAVGEVVGPYNDGLDLCEAAPHQRLRHLLRHLHRCNALFGLIRLDALRSTALLGPYGHADRVLLAELCLLGRFVELPEPLFYRRFHPGMSRYAHPSVADLAHLFDPATPQRYFFPFVRVLFEHLHAVARSPLSRAERARCLRVLLLEWRHWGRIGSELAAAVRQAVWSRLTPAG